MIKFKIKFGKTDYPITISETKEGKICVKVKDKEFFFEDSFYESSWQGRRIGVEKYLSPKRNFKEKTIKAPVAGLVSKIFVKKKKEIKKGQKIILLLSMKMENEIISDFSGKVKEVRVREGEQVKKDDILIVIV